jgi:hypothetical protein
LFFYEHAAVLGLEVAWDGSFELELGKVYTGLSWWSCVVLEGDAFTVHYPGWPDERAPSSSSRGGRERDARRWDEVVDRSCLRWPVSEGTRSPLRRGDVVEVYCRGARPASAPVPGASSRSPRRDL